MKKFAPVALIAGFTLISASLSAAPVAGRSPQNAIHESKSLERVSVSLGYETYEREINISDVPDARLRGDALSASLVFDITSQASVYAGLNQATVSHIDTGPTLDQRDDVDWFVGLHINLWNFMQNKQSPVPGQLSLGCLVEIANYTATATAGEANWDNTILALPISYEIFSPVDHSSTIHSTRFFGGPVLSQIDGKLTSAGKTSTFQERENNGLLAGVDVLITPTFAVGGQMQFFNEFSYSFNARVHF